jgi:hypothetical protein
MAMDRRRFTVLTGGALASFAFGSACEGTSFLAQAGSGRLKTRPKTGGTTSARGKICASARRHTRRHSDHAFGDSDDSPAAHRHAARRRRERDRFLQRFGTLPEEAGLPMLFVDSRGQTWDGIRGGFGPDVDFLDGALEKVFGMVAVDPTRLALGGFSDGATYALSLGLVNGDLFPRIVAFSPGFLRSMARCTESRACSSHTVPPTTFCRSIAAAA